MYNVMFNIFLKFLTLLLKWRQAAALPTIVLLCYKSNSRLHIRKLSFSVRAINIWNALLYCVLQCNTVNAFKCHLGFYLKSGMSISFG